MLLSCRLQYIEGKAGTFHRQKWQNIIHNKFSLLYQLQGLNVYFGIHKGIQR